MYNYFVALAHRVQHKVLKNTVNMKLINTFLKPVYTKYLNTIVHDMYINVLVLYSPILLLILIDMNCTNTLLWSNFLKTLLKRKTLLIFL
jgi:hypothetical protein